MLYWETAEQEEMPDLRPGALLTRSRDSAPSREREIAIGGATLAADVAAAGLIDEYRVVVHPVLVGGGIPFFPMDERRVDLELVGARTISGSFVHLAHRVVR